MARVSKPVLIAVLVVTALVLAVLAKVMVYDIALAPAMEDYIQGGTQELHPQGSK